MADLADFERRATLAEREIDDLQKRLADLETGALSEKGEESIKAYKTDLLEKLRAVRHDLAEEQAAAVSIKAERDQAVQERDRLQEENRKLKYRIVHLVRALDKYMPN
eukprot:TRINITY_DN1732_c0_g2_i2.p4 TRINITY_DN1732_c0_g2~~TRINITY_DN1732_c0_g2_i2.p4  ORF type:complete len:108 (-),score=17.84 TRINITY_DN1732_c0_g2_i2:57-380(-)